MYKYIINPKTQKKILISTNLGRKILTKYIILFKSQNNLIKYVGTAAGGFQQKKINQTKVEKTKITKKDRYNSHKELQKDKPKKLVNINGKVLSEKTLSYTGLLAQKYIPKIFLPLEIITKKHNKCQGQRKNNNIKEKLSFVKNWNLKMEKSLKCKGYSKKDIEKCIKNEFTSVNDIFIRKLQDKYININQKKKNNILVSCADCRCTAYNNEKKSIQLWIKGRNFSIINLLDIRNNNELIDYYYNAKIVIFRLAPTDYHRFHFPTAGKLLGIKKIPGTYYSVHPKLVNSKKDVFTKNSRKIVYIETTHFGVIAIACNGATCVGSIVITAKKDKIYKKGDELGYFQFGGSTCVGIFNNLVIREKLKKNSINKCETFLNVGMRIGKSDEKIKKVSKSIINSVNKEFFKKKKN